MRRLTTRKVFIDEYVGLSTRLEALTLAFLISEHFGHQVCLDWTELDALEVMGTRRKSRGLLGRIDSVKLRGRSPDEWLQAVGHRNVCLRTHAGPDRLLRERYLPTARRVRLRADLTASIRQAFAPYQGRPVIGVHIRRGDFLLGSADHFDANAVEWPAVPDWWYRHTMARLQRLQPDAAFLVSCTGSLEDFPWLRSEFEVFEVPTQSNYHYKGAGHGSLRHPAADLFALGCCSVLIGTSCSTFSHYAANMLGEPTTLLVPPSTPISAAQPAFAKAEMHGQGAHDWYAACRTGNGLTLVQHDTDLPPAAPPQLSWL